MAWIALTQFFSFSWNIHTTVQAGLPTTEHHHQHHHHHHHHHHNHNHHHYRRDMHGLSNMITCAWVGQLPCPKLPGQRSRIASLKYFD
eukprot:4934076-Amphidinium_carterae.1